MYAAGSAVIEIARKEFLVSYNEKRNFGEKKWVAPLVVVVIIIGLAIVFSGDIRNVIYPTHEASVPTG